MNQIAYKKYLLIIVAVSTALRFLLGSFLELGNDEVYYFSYALRLDWNYFDHPPIVGFLIRLTTLNLLVIQEWSIRLTGIIVAAINTWLIASMARKIGGEKMGLASALLYTSSIYCSIIGGVFILPDSPQLFFWLFSLKLALSIFSSKTGSNKNGQLLLFGLFVGITALCKIHGIFLWVGAGSYILLFQRRWLVSPYFYAAIGLTVACLLPVFWWNYQNDFITYRFHSARVNNWSAVHFQGFFESLLGQFLYGNPVNSIVYFLALLSIVRGYRIVERNTQRILLCFSLPLIVFFTLISAFRDTLPHWSGPGQIALIILGAAYLTYRSNHFNYWIIAGNFCILLAVITGFCLIQFYPGTLGSKDYAAYGEGDVTLDMNGWADLKSKFKPLYENANKEKSVRPTTFLVSNKWFPTGHLDFYVARPLKMQLIALGNIGDIHHYAWLNRERPSLKTGDNAFCIIPSNCNLNPNIYYKKYFLEIRKLDSLSQYRSGKIARIFDVYLLIRFKDTSNAHLVPLK